MHRRREEFATLMPLHVTLRVVEGLPNLRSVRLAGALGDAFRAGRERFGFRVVQFSVMSNHVHMIVEAESSSALTRGMRGLVVRMARTLNRAMNRTGRVFADRFHSKVLRSTVQVKNALLYVLNNARRHGIAFSGVIDPYSSGAWFTGWSGDVVAPRRSEPPVAPARSWQLTDGWLMHGRIHPGAVPARGRD